MIVVISSFIDFHNRRNVQYSHFHRCWSVELAEENKGGIDAMPTLWFNFNGHVAMALASTQNFNWNLEISQSISMILEICFLNNYVH